MDVATLILASVPVLIALGGVLLTALKAISSMEARVESRLEWIIRWLEERKEMTFLRMDEYERRLSELEKRSKD